MLKSSRPKMNFVCPLSLFYAFGATALTWAFLDRPFLPNFADEQLPADWKDVGEPLLLTPLIDAGKTEEAVRRSRVRPFLGYVENHSGFLTVNRTARSHLFFWFVPKIYATEDAENAPLVLWLQGGIGWSSLYGMFNENGPLKVSKKGLHQRPHAWTNKYHMLYVDQPVGTGFSFSESGEREYANSEEQIAEHLYEALVQFYKMFPRFRGRALYIVGESYAGKYVPAIGYRIHKATGGGGDSVPLKGLIIGNGYPDPENMLDYASFLYGIGLADERQRANLVKWQDVTKYSLRSGNFSSAAKFYLRLMDEISHAINTTCVFDYTREDFRFDDLYARFLTQADVRKRIHVGPVKYETNSKTVFHHLENDIFQTVRPWIEELLEHYPMLFYSGQLNIAVPHTMVESFLRGVRWSGAMQYSLAAKRAWRVDNKLAGFYRSAGNLVHVLVRNAGHMVVTDQPKNALALIDSFIEKELL